MEPMVHDRKESEAKLSDARVQRTSSLTFKILVDN